MRLRRPALFPGVALLLAAARLAAASDVLELTDDNFQSRVSDTGSAGLMLLEFFAPWCGHCKRLPAQLPAESKVSFYFHSQPEQCSKHILSSVKEGIWPKFD
uniref:Thioredoxin domain-containing protein n=1 Tax=Rhinopithecus roxellana TaxID=61622 RepID=A0A2K6RF16_RHIRO